FALPDHLFSGGPADYIPRVLVHLANASAADWYQTRVPTPCGERDIFTSSEWGLRDWQQFHEYVALWAKRAYLAAAAARRDSAIEAWQLLLGHDFFPAETGR